ncbi:hypothetical protein Q427_05255 [Halomonas sp. BC04]|nr:hypothetical protein Q427_05255 [Halomonas sp. BC04]
MICPRIEVDLAKIEYNTRALVTLLSDRGIDVTGVTKATLGSPEVASAMIAGGVSRLGDSRLENLEALRHAGIQTPLTLLRSPTPDQAERAVASANISQVSELDVVKALSVAAGRRGVVHGLVLMVELGDLREGVMPGDVLDIARRVLLTPHVTLAGLGTNLACRAGVVPSADNMGELSALATLIEARLGLHLPLVSGGNSANLAWALAAPAGRVNDLRLGESILLGCDPLTRVPLSGLYTDALTLVVPVIESLAKPTVPRGATGETAFGVATPMGERGTIIQTIAAIGRQDVDPDGLTPPTGHRCSRRQQRPSGTGNATSPGPRHGDPLRARLLGPAARDDVSVRDDPLRRYDTPAVLPAVVSPPAPPPSPPPFANRSAAAAAATR